MLRFLRQTAFSVQFFTGGPKTQRGQSLPATLSFHVGMKKLQRWNCLEQRVKLFVFFNEGRGEILAWSSFSLHVLPRRRHMPICRRQPDQHTVGGGWWIRCSDDCQNYSSLCWSQVNSGSCSFVVGFLQTRFSSTKLWWNHEALDTSIHSAIPCGPKPIQTTSVVLGIN